MLWILNELISASESPVSNCDYVLGFIVWEITFHSYGGNCTNYSMSWKKWFRPAQLPIFIYKVFGFGHHLLSIIKIMWKIIKNRLSNIKKCLIIMKNMKKFKSQFKNNKN